jgi:transcriptional regulator with XRE-family HTH domain
MALAGRVLDSDDEALTEIRGVLGLSEHELAELFGVRRESVMGWRRNGVPLQRRASVARLLDLVRVLHRDLKAERIPQIVRTHDDWLAHGTMLATIARDGPDAVYAYLRRLFAYGG